MTAQELMDKINYLARKQKTEGLTPEEKKEQKKVRKEYLERIRAQVRDHLEGMGIQKKTKSSGGHHHHGKCSCHKCGCGK